MSCPVRARQTHRTCTRSPSLASNPQIFFHAGPTDRLVAAVLYGSNGGQVRVAPSNKIDHPPHPVRSFDPIPLCPSLHFTSLLPRGDRETALDHPHFPVCALVQCFTWARTPHSLVRLYRAVRHTSTITDHHCDSGIHSPSGFLVACRFTAACCPPALPATHPPWLNNHQTTASLTAEATAECQTLRR